MRGVDFVLFRCVLRYVECVSLNRKSICGAERVAYLVARSGDIVLSAATTPSRMAISKDSISGECAGMSCFI